MWAMPDLSGDHPSFLENAAAWLIFIGVVLVAFWRGWRS